MKRIGFTGTHKGMTAEQQRTTKCFLKVEYDVHGCELHHGDCVGADEQAHNIASELGMAIVIHPPIDNKARAFCKSKMILEPKQYLRRNQEIVVCTEMLIVCPATFIEERRSGTWATWRYARKLGRKIVLILPDGEVSDAV